MKIIDPEFIRSDRVEFGATVTVENEEGETRTWTIVGNGEADVEKGTISWRSPLAKAVWSKKVGDVVELMKPKGEEELEKFSQLNTRKASELCYHLRGDSFFLAFLFQFAALIPDNFSSKV